MLTAADIAAASGGQLHEQDPRLEPALQGAYARIKAWCGWHVAPSLTETITLDTAGGQRLNLPSMHVTDVAELKILGEVVPKERYTWSRAGMIKLRTGCFPDEFSGVEVTLTHGYEDMDVVHDIAKSLTLGHLASPMGATREQAGDISISWARTGGGLLQSDMEALAPYRLQHWG